MSIEETLSCINDIEKLQDMLKIYKSTQNINGQMFQDMIVEIESQISYCKTLIK